MNLTKQELSILVVLLGETSTQEVNELLENSDNIKKENKIIKLLKNKFELIIYFLICNVNKGVKL